METTKVRFVGGALIINSNEGEADLAYVREKARIKIAAREIPKFNASPPVPETDAAYIKPAEVQGPPSGI
ncbi:MAG: hypothetical protein KAJ58_02535 [Candidatus Pacebacteria bacterium]|nr:hypothetical protein [Candidatus Paceibacterota bacterium]